MIKFFLRKDEFDPSDSKMNFTCLLIDEPLTKIQLSIEKEIPYFQNRYVVSLSFLDQSKHVFKKFTYNGSYFHQVIPHISPDGRSFTPKQFNSKFTGTIIRLVQELYPKASVPRNPIIENIVSPILDSVYQMYSVIEVTES